ncbi:winged helix-turn-helix transcriptional regulator [Kitasatospora sp. NPDC006697]|uniref:winged helix-turn-helix transcriptional regulator n=1 Tax=Kitasatospora sp. NPDC006697 TaxID=3364020 RepID=UPI0036B5D77F
MNGSGGGRPAGGATVAVPPVLDAAATALYRSIAANGGRVHPRDLPADALPPLDELRRLDLLTEVLDGSLALVDPRLATTRLRDRYHAAALDLLQRAASPAPVYEDLAEAYARTPSAATPVCAGGGISTIEDFQEIQARIENLAVAAQHEMLVMHPGGARPARALRKAKAAAGEYLGRGIDLRIIYQLGARTDPATSDYAAHVTALGGRVRVLDEPFLRLMVIDRAVAVLSGYQDNRMASFVEDPVLIGLAVDQFERDWGRAERVRWDGAAGSVLGELLAQGLTQRGIAKRLGLSERTVAAQIARLREEYDADTLFQLGWLMRGRS